MELLLRRLAFGLTAAVPVTACLGDEVAPTDHKGPYALGGRIHVGPFGHPDGVAINGGN